MAIPIYSFGLGEPVSETSKEVVGGKGASLVWMTNNGFPVPPGFILPTSVWAQYRENPVGTLQSIATDIQPYLDKLRDHFGYMPLLSVRSGARVSCPGMMDTVLNVGLLGDDDLFWSDKLGAEGYDNSTARLISMFADVVMGAETKYNHEDGAATLMGQYAKDFGPFPKPKDQLLLAIEAVFKSWDNDRAKFYRKQNNIPDEWGTAVTVQAMVFGNRNDKSCTGVLFTRNCSTGENVLTGEFLVNAQGEDVVAGTHTPKDFLELATWNGLIFQELKHSAVKMEEFQKEVQDIEFTVEDGKLYFLQSRAAKRSSLAALRFALDLHKEGLITAEEAVKRVSPKDLHRAQQDIFDPKVLASKTPVLSGLAACSGIAVGIPVFSAEEAVASNIPCILVADETTPDDIEGMTAAVGVITRKGGLTSHAAVVARSMNKPCITGVGQGSIPHTDYLSMDGTTGQVYTGMVSVLLGTHNGIVDEFHALALKVAQAMPILYSIPKHPVEGDAVLDVVGLGIPTTEMAAFIFEVAHKVNGTLYVDFNFTGRNSTEFLFSHLTSGTTNYASIIKQVVKFNPNVKVIASGLDPALGPEFEERFVRDGLNNLITSKGTVLTYDSEPARRVLEWRKGEENFTAITVGETIEGCLSFLTPQAALQRLQS